jgi:formate dehydrogenase maturation protein FdhE
MRHQDTDARVIEVDHVIARYPYLSKLLELQKVILNAQREIREDPCKGTSVNWSNLTAITRLQQKAFARRSPIAGFIDNSIFDTDSSRNMSERLSTLLIEQGFNRKMMEKLLEGIQSGNIIISELAGGALQERIEYLEELGTRWDVHSRILLLIADSLVQPCLEEISSNVDSIFLEEWRQCQCPVCGRRPIVGLLESRRRHLVCTLCGAKYLVDLFLCVNCGNVDPTYLKFLVPEDNPEFRVDFCEKCRHYLKIIDQDRLRIQIPRGLEDLVTLYLDMMARDAGLKRPYFV